MLLSQLSDLVSRMEDRGLGGLKGAGGQEKWGWKMQRAAPSPRISAWPPASGAVSERPPGNRKKFISGYASPKPISDLDSGLKQQVA